MIRGFDHLPVMFDDDHRVAGRGQVLQNPGQQIRIAGMEANRRFIENIQCPYQVSAQLIRQRYTLSFAARQRFCLPP